VPTIQQVVSGAAVSIVLKEDQPTGHEVQGTVQDILTRGNHPRGIKVRLQDGRVGRVQRMAGSTAAVPIAAVESTTNTGPPPLTNRTNRIVRIERDVRLDEGDFLSEPPSRSLADYFPDLGSQVSKGHDVSKSKATSTTAKCPICGVFEGDEWAVSRHVEEHLT